MRNHNTEFMGYLASLGMVLGACARDNLSLGEDSLREALIPSASCAASPIIDGDVRVSNQAELDALAGCEEVSGELTIEIFPGTDLRPLADLRAVGSRLVIGARSSTLDEQEVIALQDAGWLESFEGVEGLERVGGLTLTSFSASDLSAFSSLRSVSAGGSRLRYSPGQLQIAYAKNLVDLRGLERVDGVATLLLLELSELQSLAGLRVTARFDSVLLQKMPRLKSIDALGVFERGDSLGIIETGLEDSSGLSSLAAVQVVQIEGNPLLADVSPITRASVSSLSIVRNPSLQGTLQFSTLSFELGIAENDELEGVVFDEPAAAPVLGGLVSIRGNAKLRSVTSPNGYRLLDTLEVLDNSSLEALDLGSMRRLDELHIRDNPNLSSLSHADFERIYVVDVVDNPRLSVGSLAAVPAFERNLEGNAD